MTTVADKLSFSPINGVHAIVEMAIFVNFSPEFSSSTINKLVFLKDDLKEFFPKVNNVEKMDFTIDGTHTSADKHLVGIELQKINLDGNIDWMLRTSENSISVHCLNYTQWDIVFADAIKYLKATFKYLEGSENFISNIGLMYIDRFICDKTPESSNLSELFNKDTDLVFKGAFGSENKLWHSHTGWYEKLDDMPCLNQLKTSASYANIKNSKKLVVTVDHSAIITGKNDTFVDYSEVNGSCQKLEGILGKLHDMNKRVLAELLTEQMSTQIKLVTS